MLRRGNCPGKGQVGLQQRPYVAGPRVVRGDDQFRRRPDAVANFPAVIWSALIRHSWLSVRRLWNLVRVLLRGA